MNYREFFRHWNEVQEVTLRLIRQIPENKLDYKPEGGELTIREMVTHIYFVERTFARTGQKHDLEKEDISADEMPYIETLDELYNYARETHKMTHQAFSGKSDRDFEEIVSTPWGDDTLFLHILSTYEYLWHIRGQLYLCLQMLGVKNLVYMYDYQRETTSV
jgi:uncharacterized damage-inducible protein DinB